MMTVELDRPVHVGGVTVAAIVRRSVHTAAWAGLAIHGAKRPLAVLVHREGLVVGFEANGRSVPLDDLRRRFPDPCAEFERLTASDTSSAI